MFWAVYITRFSWRGTNGVHMWLTRSKESLHGVSMLLTKTGWLSPRPAVQRTPEPVEAKRGGREYNRWQSGYKKPAGLHNIFHRLEPPLGASSMASLNLDRCLNIPDDYQGRTRFDHCGVFEDALYCQATRQISSASQTIMKTRSPTWWSPTGWSWTELRSWPGTASTTCSGRAGLSSHWSTLNEWT